ncbi:hypothetical protein QL285_005383 [Trifolium repens]|nr:hypothetical protein QL285_005383 [Trifolium repens]
MKNINVKDLFLAEKNKSNNLFSSIVIIVTKTKKTKVEDQYERKCSCCKVFPFHAQTTQRRKEQRPEKGDGGKKKIHGRTEDCTTRRRTTLVGDDRFRYRKWLGQWRETEKHKAGRWRKKIHQVGGETK